MAFRHLLWLAERRLPVYALQRESHCASPAVCSRLYCSLGLPYLTYCLEVWGNTYKSLLYSLTHKRSAVRIIHKVGIYPVKQRLIEQSTNIKQSTDIQDPLLMTSCVLSQILVCFLTKAKQRLYCLRKLAKFNVKDPDDPFLQVLC